MALFKDSKLRPTYWAGICNAGVYSTTPFSIVHAGRGPMVLGIVSSNADPTPGSNDMIRQLLDAEDLEATMASPVELKKAQLLKLVVNAIINPLTVIFNCKNGQLFDQEPRTTLMKTLLKEAGAVARALLPVSDQGADVFSDEQLTDLVLSIADKTGKNTSSMLQDIRAGRQTEIDYISGYIVRQGMGLGLPCPKNSSRRATASWAALHIKVYCVRKSCILIVRTEYEVEVFCCWLMYCVITYRIGLGMRMDKLPKRYSTNGANNDEIDFSRVERRGV